LNEMRAPPSAPLLPYAELSDRFQTVLSEIIANADAGDRESARRFLAEHEFWLIPDALYAGLSQEHGTATWRHWNLTPQGILDQKLYASSPPGRVAAERLSALKGQYSRQIEDYALVQWLLAQEHAQLRSRLKPLGLDLFADLQVGLAVHDEWAWQSLFLSGYRLGAPPSRTNPNGQHWGYAVLDPAQVGTGERPGPALRFVQVRLHKVFGECDGLRIDHPHGWVDPWVYRSDDSDPDHAVQHGARLFSSPSEPDHSSLTAFAIAQPEQIDLAMPRYADDRVSCLDEAQVARYSVLIDEIVQQARENNCAPSAIACEVLSTLPYPVRRVLERHGLGRFRVTQKANLEDPADVYRIENVQPADWIMLGTHDTPTIWALAHGWCQGPQGKKWEQYLARLLKPECVQSPCATQIADSPNELIHALFTAMLASRARNVMVFFPDLMGLTDRYNQPGLVLDSNWRLRLSSDFDETYENRRRQGEALDVRRCLDVALGFS
jgi:4-alpha-glucanotransferase